MTEDKWLAAVHSKPMLNFLEGKVSDRKLRLFACACARHFWDRFKDARSRRAIEVAERYADGLARASDLAKAGTAAYRAISRPNDRNEGSSRSARSVCWLCCDVDAQEAADSAAYAGWGRFRGSQQVRLLHCIFGNPFRIPVIEPPRLTWNDSTTDKIAQRIYDERDFSLMPILADALEEAGCDNDDILRHCREPGEHVRGCWVIDQLLGNS